MTENKIIKPFVKMPDNIALDFILYTIQPDNIPLGIPFGWLQPSEDSTITLGSIYLGVNNDNLTIGELFNLDDYPLELKKGLIREFKNDTGLKRLQSNDILNLDFIAQLEHPSILYSELEPEHKILYRLAILALNTMTEAHNWAVSFLENLGYYYYNFNSEGKNWQVYMAEGLNQNTNEYINNFLEYSDRLAYELDFLGYNLDSQNNDECYHYFNEWDDINEDLRTWILELVESNDTRLKEYNLKFYNSEAISTIAFFITWIKSEWDNGYLTLELSDNMPKSIYNWYKNYKSQMILPNIE